MDCSWLHLRPVAEKLFVPFEGFSQSPVFPQILLQPPVPSVPQVHWFWKGIWERRWRCWSSDGRRHSCRTKNVILWWRCGLPNVSLEPDFYDGIFLIRVVVLKLFVILSQGLHQVPVAWKVVGYLIWLLKVSVVVKDLLDPTALSVLEDGVPELLLAERPCNAALDRKEEKDGNDKDMGGLSRHDGAPKQVLPWSDVEVDWLIRPLAGRGRVAATRWWLPPLRSIGPRRSTARLNRRQNRTNSLRRTLRGLSSRQTHNRGESMGPTGGEPFDLVSGGDTLGPREAEDRGAAMVSR